MSVSTGFFVAGGTLGQGAQSYVVRKADRDLIDALRNREFAYVLDSRQKGKSSLMIRVRRALEEEGTRTVLLDLQRFGSNLDPERWYASLLDAVDESLDASDQLFGAWEADRRSGPMRRFFNSIEELLAERDLRVVVFVDEVDFVRSLPFNVDEFFAGIRECHNRSATGQQSRLTFCLLGVANPSELIHDVRITPFNIGRRIELTDFTLAELEPFHGPLSEGGRDGRLLTERVHRWTGGHPYLTQRLAAAVAADPTIRSGGGVDRLAEALFLGTKARTEEPNLSDASRRMLEAPIEGLHASESRSRVLDAYLAVLEETPRPRRRRGPCGLGAQTLRFGPSRGRNARDPKPGLQASFRSFLGGSQSARCGAKTDSVGGSSGTRSSYWDRQSGHPCHRRDRWLRRLPGDSTQGSSTTASSCGGSI